MSVYTDHDVKSRAFERFLDIIASRNKSLGERLIRGRNAIFSTAIANIQRIGVHAYAETVLGRRSELREELEMAIERQRYAA